MHSFHVPPPALSWGVFVPSLYCIDPTHPRGFTMKRTSPIPSPWIPKRKKTDEDVQGMDKSSRNPSHAEEKSGLTETSTLKPFTEHQKLRATVPNFESSQMTRQGYSGLGFMPPFTNPPQYGSSSSTKPVTEPQFRSQPVSEQAFKVTQPRISQPVTQRQRFRITEPISHQRSGISRSSDRPQFTPTAPVCERPRLDIKIELTAGSPTPSGVGGSIPTTISRPRTASVASSASTESHRSSPGATTPPPVPSPTTPQQDTAQRKKNLGTIRITTGQDGRRRTQISWNNQQANMHNPINFMGWFQRVENFLVNSA